MGTEVLRPHDLFGDRFGPSSFHRRRNIPANNSGNNLSNILVTRRPHNNSHNNRKTSPKKKPVIDAKKNRKDDVTTAGSNKAAPRVTLLRRGESLDSLTSKIKGGANANPNSSPKSSIRKPSDDLAVIGTRRIGPDSPEMVPKQIRTVAVPAVDMYAGSAMFSSPSPKALPLPSFFSKKQEVGKPFDDSATRDLRRLLRLEI